MCRRLPPGTFGVSPDHRTRRVSRPLFRGYEEVGNLRDPANDRWETDYGRQGKKTDDRGRKKKNDGGGNRYKGQMSGPGEVSGIPRGKSPEQRRFRGNLRWTLKTVEKRGPCHSVSAPKNQKGRKVISLQRLSTFGPHFFGLGGKKRVRGGKPELRSDPGSSSPPISRASRVLNLPISRFPGDSPASGPTVRQM